MCQYPVVLYYIVEAQKRYCRLSLHNPALSQRTKTPQANVAFPIVNIVTVRSR